MSFVLAMVLLVSGSAWAQRPVAPYESQQFSYRIDLSIEGGWKTSPGISSRAPFADFVVQQGDSTVFGVVPVWLSEQTIDRQAVTNAMLDLLGPEWRLLPRKPLKIGDWQGESFGAPKGDPLATTLRKGVVLFEGQYAFLIFGRTEAHADEPLLNKAIASVVIGKPAPIGSMGGNGIDQKFALGKTPRSMLRAWAAIQIAQGAFLVQNRKLGEAIRFYERAAALSRDFKTVSALIAFTADQRRNVDAAVNLARRLLNPVDSEHRELVLWLVRVGSQMNRNDIVRDVLERWLVVHPDDWELLAELTVVRIQQDDWRGLLAQLEKRPDKHTPNVALSLARLLIETQDNANDERAMALLKELPNEQRVTVFAVWSELIVLNRRGTEPQRMLDLLAKIAIQDRDYVWHCFRGHALTYQGRLELAKKAYEDAAKKAPTGVDLSHLIAAASNAMGQGVQPGVDASLTPVSIPGDLLQPAPLASLTTKTGYGYLLYATGMSYDKDNNQKVTRQRVIHVFDQAGAQELNVISIQFSLIHERINVHVAQVEDSKGNVIAKVDPRSMYVQSVATSDVASHEAVLNIPIPGLKPDSVLRLSTTTVTTGGKDRRPSFEDYFFAPFQIARKTTFISGPTDDVAVFVSPGIKIEQRPDGVAYEAKSVWLQNEPFAADLSEFVDRLYIAGNKRTWTDISNNYLKLIHDKLELDVFDQVMAQNLVKDIPQDQTAQRLRKIARHVQDGLSYRAVAFGSRGLIPQMPSQALRARVGDCKDHSIILHLMLKEIGITSHLALVNANARVIPTVPDQDAFDHMILMVPATQGLSSDLWIDLTLKHNDPLVPVNKGGTDRFALLLDAANPRLVNLPELPPLDYTLKRVVRMQPDTTLRIEETLVADALFAAMIRNSLQGVRPEDQRVMLKEFFSISDPAVTDLNIAIDNQDDLLKPLTLNVNYKLNRNARRIGKQLLVDFPMAYEHDMFALDASSARTLPIRTSKIRLTSTLKIELPPGMKLDEMGVEPHAISDRFHDIQVSVDKQQQTATFVMKNDEKVFPAADWPEFAKARSQAAAIWAPALLVTPAP
jgi:tetratricopeptide (TPR) repeat protein